MIPLSEQLPSIIGLLNELSDDACLPKNVKFKIQNVIQILNNSEEPTIRANKALQELDDISEANNLHQYIRTQIWNVVSILSKIN